MKSKFTQEEKETLCELVFLGNWMINSYRMPNAQIRKYEKLAKKIVWSLERNEGKKTSCGDLWDFYFDNLGEFVYEYENACWLQILAEKLAKAHFPKNSKTRFYCGSSHMCCDVAYIYEKELREKGVSILSIDVPDLDERLEFCRQEFKKR